MNLDFTEEQLSIILQALSFYQYTNPHISEEQYNIAETVICKVDELII